MSLTCWQRRPHRKAGSSLAVSSVAPRVSLLRRDREGGRGEKRDITGYDESQYLGKGTCWRAKLSQGIQSRR